MWRVFSTGRGFGRQDSVTGQGVGSRLKYLSYCHTGRGAGPFGHKFPLQKARRGPAVLSHILYPSYSTYSIPPTAESYSCFGTLDLKISPLLLLLESYQKTFKSKLSLFATWRSLLKTKYLHRAQNVIIVQQCWDFFSERQDLAVDSSCCGSHYIFSFSSDVYWYVESV